MRWKRGTSRTLGAAGPEAELEESGAEITLVYTWGNGKKQGQLTRKVGLSQLLGLGPQA